MSNIQLSYVDNLQQIQTLNVLFLTHEVSSFFPTWKKKFPNTSLKPKLYVAIIPTMRGCKHLMREVYEAWEPPCEIPPAEKGAAVNHHLEDTIEGHEQEFAVISKSDLSNL